MLQYFKNVLQCTSTETNKHSAKNDRLKIATCALFLEIANSDDNLSREELNEVYKIMRRSFSLDDDEIDELIKLSEEQIKKSVSLYEFTNLINSSFSYDEKYEIIKNLWRIILADDILDPHEEHFIKIINGNFNFYHKELIAAKLEVVKELAMQS